MKQKWLLALVAFTLTTTAQADDKQTAQLQHVTVFTDGAQVTRTKSIALKGGEQTVIFTGMSPYMDTRSLQVKANGKLTVLGINHRTAVADSIESAQRRKQAEQALEEVNRKIRLTKDEQEVISLQCELVKTNCSVAGRTVATPVAGIKELNTYYAQELLSLKKRSQTLDDQLANLEKERKQKAHTYDSLARIKPRNVTDVEVKLTAPQAGRATFTITYYTSNASWYPSYDIYSQGTGQPMDLSYKVNIIQNTKEDWSNADVTLSSANPNRSNVAPKLTTYWLDFNEPIRTYSSMERGKAKKPEPMMVYREEMVDGAKPVEIEEVDEESDIIEVKQRQMQFGYEFHIAQPISMPSSTKAVTTEIARHQLLANYIYKGYPKKDKDAFLVADATDWQRLNLLKGEANIFFENSYAGKTTIDPSQDTDTLHFSLGRDPSINLKRTKVNENSSRKFLGSSQEQTMTWRNTVKNTRREAVNIIVSDQIPVSRNDDIDVSVVELSGGQLNERTGFVTWQLQLQPGEQRDLLLQYKVKYPKNRSVDVE